MNLKWSSWRILPGKEGGDLAPASPGLYQVRRTSGQTVALGVSADLSAALRDLHERGRVGVMGRLLPRRPLSEMHPDLEYAVCVMADMPKAKAAMEALNRLRSTAFAGRMA